jgi:hypothetical protein
LLWGFQLSPGIRLHPNQTMSKIFLNRGNGGFWFRTDIENVSCKGPVVFQKVGILFPQNLQDSLIIFFISDSPGSSVRIPAPSSAFGSA